MKPTHLHVASILILLVSMLVWAVPANAFTPAAVGAPAPAAAAAPVITVWYASSLNFGQIGNPQTQINILGNVSDPGNQVASLSYRLNNGSSVNLTLGPDGTRLNNPGDFDAALNITSLKNGPNSLVLTAKDSGGGTLATAGVNLNYTKGKVWPLPYTTSWSTAANINAQAQVVDGQWQITSSGIRPTQFGYDRLVALGDVSWSNYEVLVPITIHQFLPVSGDPGGVGVITRWQGHVGPGQPPTDWTQLGAYAYYSNRTQSLALRLNANDPITQDLPSFALNKTYLFKIRAETVAQGGRYSFKVWEQGQPEPDWNNAQFNKIVNVVDSNNDLLKGSVLLVAHRTDATFGDVTVCPLDASNKPTATYPLTVNVVGSGTVTPPAGKTTYNCGQGVTLTATPAPGWVFDSWIIANKTVSTQVSYAFNVTQATTITARFRQGQPVNLPNKLYIPVVVR